MRWRDALALAARGVGRRPGRAALTVMAVALATALLTSLLALAATGRGRVLSEVTGGGPLAGIKVSAAAPSPGQLDSDNPRPGRARDLDDDARRRIARLPGVASVSPVVAVPVLVIPPDPPVTATAIRTRPARSVAGFDGRPGARGAAPVSPDPPEPFEETMVGVDLADADRLPVTVLAGRLPGAAAANEVAVTEGYLERLGLEPADAAAVVGTEVQTGAPRIFDDGFGVRLRGRWTRALVVGVVAQEAAPGQVLAPLEAAREAWEWATSGAPRLGRFEVPSSPYSGLFVIARGLDRVGEVRAAITEVGYATAAPENLIATVVRYVRVVEIVLGAIGLIALLVAALGITNALLAAVRERRREIGVLKAIGARDGDVARAFLMEAGFLGFVGGVIGTVAGFGLSRAVGAAVNGYLAGEGLAGVTVGLPWLVAAGAVVGAAALAMAAGAIPALRAARLPAADAMGGL